MWKFTNKYVSNNTHGKINEFSRNTATWLILHRQLIATYRPMHRPTVGRYIGWPSVDYRSTIGRLSVTHVKSEDICIPRYLKLRTLLILWSKIETVKSTLLSRFLLLPISMHLVLSKFKVSLWSWSHFATPSKSLFN